MNESHEHNGKEKKSDTNESLCMVPFKKTAEQVNL